MSTAAHPAPTPAPPVGSGMLVVLWFVFFVLALASPVALDDTWRFARDLPLLPEIVAWIVFLPWMVALAIRAGDWATWVQIATIAAIAIGSIAVFSPRAPDTQR